MAKTRLEKIEEIRQERERLANREKELLQAQRTQERKDRTKRLCKRAGLLESLLPDTIALTEEQFKIFIEKTMLTDFTRRILDGMKQNDTAAATPESADGARVRE